MMQSLMCATTSWGIFIRESRYVLSEYLRRRHSCSNFLSLLFRHKKLLDAHEVL